MKQLVFRFGLSHWVAEVVKGQVATDLEVNQSENGKEIVIRFRGLRAQGAAL